MERFVSKLKAASVVCVDGNVPVETIQYICDKCCEYRVPGIEISVTVYEKYFGELIFIKSISSLFVCSLV